nr:ADP-dependent glucokinase/phosphofructokinase [uncultured Lichenicoccus sp.]
MADWATEYHRAALRLDALTARARLTLCGLSACVDATISLHDALPVLLSGGNPQAAAFADLLLARATAGIGGEMRVDWPDGPDWLDRRLTFRHALGGTGPHAARVLTHLGAPSLLALATRSPEQLAVLDPRMRLARDGRSVEVAHLSPTGANVTKIYIFEFTAGRLLGGARLARSSRIIVRFNDPGLEDDAEFAGLSRRLAGEAGAAVLSGYNGIGGGDMRAALALTRSLIARWQRDEPLLIHLELAGYDRDAYRDTVLEGLAGRITSLGLSLSEYQALMPKQAPLAEGMADVARRLGLRRVCVHADNWAAAVTTGDVAREREALLVGCLLAGSRAASGTVARPTGAFPEAQFEAPPEASGATGEWRFVSVSAPYLPSPATTLGLGDTFMAGCLLVLGQRGQDKTETNQGTSR